MKRFISLAIAIIMVLAFSVPAMAAGQDPSTCNHSWQSNGHCAYCDKFRYEGTGAIILRTKSDYIDFIFGAPCNAPNYAGQKIVMDADIDLGRYQVPLSGFTFKGEFEGNGHTLKGLYIPSTRECVMFGILDGAKISNVTFEVESDSHYADNHGILASTVCGNTVISNVTLKGTNAIGQSNNGAFFGVAKEGAYVQLNNCINNVNFSIYQKKGGLATNAGGFFGLIEQGAKVKFTGCTNNGNFVSGPYETKGTFTDKRAENIGGFVGNCYGTVEITSSVNNGEIVASTAMIGGFIGNLDDRNSLGSSKAASKLTGNTNYGKISGANFAGGLIGEIENINNDQSYDIYENINRGSVSGNAMVGGIIGIINTDGMNSNYTKNKNYGEIISEHNSAGGIVGASYGGKNYSDNENYGMINGKNGNAGGIIGYSDDDDVILDNTKNEGTIKGNNSVGGIIGYFGNDSNDPSLKITNSSNSGTITSNNGAAGGIAGFIDSDGAHAFENVSNTAAVTGGRSAGGILAETEGPITFNNAVNNGTVAAKGSNAGGILAWGENNEVTFIDCSNAGNVTGKNETGGILGYVGDRSWDCNMYFEKCTNSGNIVSENHAGGIAGVIDSDGMHKFERVTNTGSVTGGWTTGGICGETYGTTFFTGDKNEGNIKSLQRMAGGILGWRDDDGISFINCSNKGKITGKDGQYTIYGGGSNDGISYTGCSNYAASIFIEYSVWIIGGCAIVIAAVAVILIMRKRRKSNVA